MLTCILAPLAVVPLTADQAAAAPNTELLSSAKPAAEAAQVMTRLLPLVCTARLGSSTGSELGPVAKEAAACEGVIPPAYKRSSLIFPPQKPSAMNCERPSQLLTSGSLESACAADPVAESTPSTKRREVLPLAAQETTTCLCSLAGSQDGGAGTRLISAPVGKFAVKRGNPSPVLGVRKRKAVLLRQWCASPEKIKIWRRKEGRGA